MALRIISLIRYFIFTDFINKNCGFGQASDGIIFIPYFVSNSQLPQTFNRETHTHTHIYVDKLVILKAHIISFGVRGDSVG